MPIPADTITAALCAKKLSTVKEFQYEDGDIFEVSFCKAFYWKRWRFVECTWKRKPPLKLTVYLKFTVLSPIIPFTPIKVEFQNMHRETGNADREKLNQIWLLFLFQKVLQQQNAWHSQEKLGKTGLSWNRVWSKYYTAKNDYL